VTTAARRRPARRVGHRGAPSGWRRRPSYGDVVLASRPVTHPDFPDAVVRTPTVVRVDVDERDKYLLECFGPGLVPRPPGSTASRSTCLGRSVARPRGHHRGRLRGPTTRCSTRPRMAALVHARCRAVVQPHRDRVREPVRGLQRLPRDRREPGRQLRPDRRRLRGQPVPDGPVPPLTSPPDLAPSSGAIPSPK
jgi:hypothetical protein